MLSFLVFGALPWHTPAPRWAPNPKAPDLANQRALQVVSYGASHVWMFTESSWANREIGVLLSWWWRWHWGVIFLLRAPRRRTLAVQRTRSVGTSLAFFLMLDTSVLEPDLDLFLWQVQVGGNLDAPQSGQVHVWSELTFKLQELRAGERCAHALAALELAVAGFCIKKNNMEKDSYWNGSLRR